MSTALPLDESAPERSQPWILYILEVNALNFCSFACCPPTAHTTQDGLLVAVPNTLESEAVSTKLILGGNIYLTQLCRLIFSNFLVRTSNILLS